ncbi:MAG: DUF3536 domain-containing protein [Polyangiaceae bacterium]|nr:DUF3536 domain-containing protein [Polyangiaceae bacterium]
MTTPPRYVTIHGHFYQPPRENPYTGAVPLQPSASPHHDWNARVTAECYRPNARARRLDATGALLREVSNYERISFDFGPTLLSWLEVEAPDVYLDILAADRAGVASRGHGPAMAQAYNHMILPLACDRDRRTQVRWGKRDFEHRFGRAPEGMWLPETAVCTATLEALVDEGIRFTVLAPRQASHARDSPRHAWRDVGGGRIDPSRAYLVRLPSGRAIAVFFYDGPVSQGVAFEGLLHQGERLASRLSALFHGRDEAALVHIATDGETYGHHHAKGEMALAHALELLAAEGIAPVSYAEFLARHPPTSEARIVERSSWSCEHGVERWRSDCGCSMGTPGFRQAWRAPLRRAFDGLRDALARSFEQAAGPRLRDPWAARDAWIDVVLSPDRAADFFDVHAVPTLTHEGRRRAALLLEAQRHAMLMYTSCAWFFDDLAGLEPTQGLVYAGRAVELARAATGVDLWPVLAAGLRAAESNLPGKGNGEDLLVRAMAEAHAAASR